MLNGVPINIMELMREGIEAEEVEIALINAHAERVDYELNIEAPFVGNFRQ